MSTTHSDGMLGGGSAGSKLLTVNELAAQLGISKWTLYKLARAEAIRSVRVGEQIRFRPADVEAYLERGAP